MKTSNKQLMIYAAVIIAVAVIVIISYACFRKTAPEVSFASGNGRIEATEVDVAAKFPGKLAEILVREGDFVEIGQVLARFDTKELEARLHQAEARVEQARQNKNYALAVLEQRRSELAMAEKNLDRSQNLYVDQNISLVQLQQHETAVASTRALFNATKAQVVSSEAAIRAAMAQAETIRVNLEDSILRSPIYGRVLYRLAEPGEIIGSGGKVFTLLELCDVYMTVFLPTAYAGRVDIGAEARIVLDAIPHIAIPARVTFISPQSQFTPKEIETKTEREKLMFRIKITVNPDLVKAYIEKVKTGLPGAAYIRMDDTAPWPETLSRLPRSGLSAKPEQR